MTISHVYMNKCRFLEVMWSMLFECCSFQNVKLFVYWLAAWKITCDLTNFVIQCGNFSINNIIFQAKLSGVGSVSLI